MASQWERIAAATKKQAEEEARRADEAGKWADGYKENADAASARANSAEHKLAALLRTIPTPKPVPNESPALATALVTEGFQIGATVYDDHEPSKLNRADAEKTWAWNQQAAMVPSLRASLGAAQEAASSRKDEAMALRLALTFTEEKGEAWKRAHDLQQQRGDVLDSQAQALTKSLKARKVQTWMMVGGALVVGFLAGGKR